MARILVVDDRPTNFQLLEAVLGYYGHQVDLAADGAQALARLSDIRADLVITDLLMPNTNGEQLVRAMRADPALRAVPVIIHTASYLSRDARRIADGLGVRWVLPKPSEPREIIAMVSEALGVEVTHPASAGQGASAPGRAGVPADQTLQEPREPQERLTHLLQEALELARMQVGQLEKPDREEGPLARRLERLVRLAVRMSWERDLGSVVELFCDAVQDMTGARYAGVAIVKLDGEPAHFSSRGVDAMAVPALRREIGRCDAARQVLDGPARARMLVASRPGDFTGLPESHPPVTSLLACAVMARDNPCGWLYVADRLGGGGFGVDDERLLMALGALLGAFWASLRAMEELDRRVVQRTSELAAANEELEAFSMIVSHDLRAPLGSIGGFARALSEKYGADLPPEGQHYLDRIGTNVAKMSRLIDDLLRLARVSRTPIHKSNVNLAQVVGQCLEIFQDEIRERAAVVLVGDLPLCRGDPGLLGQVLQNLIGNAVKYTRQQPQPVVEIGSRAVGGECVVFVRDNGAGFDAQFAAQLFAPFSRLHAEAEFEGSGVGLAIVKQIVTRHGGRVWAESQPGEGACFTFTLPLAGTAGD